MPYGRHQEDLDMLNIMRLSPQDVVCGTCCHWTGARISHDDGNIIVVSNLKGICDCGKNLQCTDGYSLTLRATPTLPLEPGDCGKWAPYGAGDDVGVS